MVSVMTSEHQWRSILTPTRNWLTTVVARPAIGRCTLSIEPSLDRRGTSLLLPSPPLRTPGSSDQCRLYSSASIIITRQYCDRSRTINLISTFCQKFWSSIMSHMFHTGTIVFSEVLLVYDLVLKLNISHCVLSIYCPKITQLIFYLVYLPFSYVFKLIVTSEKNAFFIDTTESWIAGRNQLFSSESIKIITDK